MSTEDAKRLLEAVSKNEDLKRRLREVGTSGISAFAREQGFTVTNAEFTEAAKAVATQQLHEKLSGTTTAGIVGVGNIGVV